MGLERTLVLLKPDALKRKKEDEILDRFLNNGLMMVDWFKTDATESQLREHYEDVINGKGEYIGQLIIDYMTSGQIIAVLLEGDDAVKVTRDIVGIETEPVKCRPGTIRYDFAADSYELAEKANRAVENLVHVSGSKTEAEKEISIWFKNAIKKPLYDYIAETISNVRPELIKAVVDNSNKNKILYHGIKMSNSIAKIMAEGLKPQTPESGPCSFWATGVSLFYPTIDSPFFRYSGHHDKINSPNICSLQLAIASCNQLSERVYGMPKFQPNSHVKICDTVPHDMLTILSIKVMHPGSEDHQQLRAYRQAAEQMALDFISNELANFTPKGLFYFREEIK